MQRSQTRERPRRTVALAVVLAGLLTCATSLPVSAVVSNGARPTLQGAWPQEVSGLWHVLATGDTTHADAYFYPESAYLTIKAISGASSDYRYRLLALYHLDIAAYHALLIAHGTPTFLRAEVNTSYEAWIPPGYCENKVGYWHLPGIRFVYRSGGVVRSIGLLSFISWHASWYVIHLGPNPRATNVGMVYLPEDGPGVAGPPGSC